MSSGSLTDALRETLSEFDESGPPLTTSEVAERLDLGRRSTYDRLERLAERGDLETKKVGANARVWWRPGRESTARHVAEGDFDHGSEQLALLVDAVDEYAIFMLDTEGRVRTWNPGAEQIKGYEPEEILGEHFSTFYTEDDREAGVPDENLAAAAADGVTTDEGWRVRADGSTFWAHVTITAVHDEDDDLVGFAKVTRDMTDRRERERAVRRERNLLDQVLETSPIGIGVFHPDGSVDRMNARMADILWLSADEAEMYELGDPRLYDPSGDALAFSETPVGRVIETGEPVSDREVRIEDSEHGSRWLSVDAAPLAVDGDGFDRVVAAATDVTQHKVQAQRLERQRDGLIAELDEMYERIDDAFYALDDEFRFTYVNDRAEELLRHDESELLGEVVWEVFPEATETPAWDSFHRSLDEQVSTSYEVYFGPSEIWVEAHVYPSETGLSVYFRDVTERKQRQQELERYRTVVETMVDGVFVTDAEGRFAMVNDTYVEMTGYSREELIGADTSLVIGEENREEGREMIEDILEGKQDVGVWELTQHRADGGTNLVESRFTLLPNDGEYRGSVGVIRDVTERKERERELERYEQIIETVDDGVYLVSPEGEFTLVNEAYARMTGYSREELVGMSVGELVDEETVERALDYEEEMIVGERETARFEADVIRADGDTFRAEGVFSIIEGDDGDHERVGVVRDITERKERERELREARLQLEAATEAGAVGTWEWQVQEDRFVAGPSLAKQFGVDYEEAREGVPLDWFMASIHEGDRDRIEREVDAALSSCGEYEEEYRVRNADDEIRWVLARGHVECDDEGNPVTFPGAIVDITERKRVQQQLEEERDMFGEGPAVVMRWEIGEGWPVGYVSDNVEEVLGYTPAELESGELQYRDLLLDEEIDRITREVRENSDETTERFSHEPYRVRTRDGGVRWVKDVTKILRDESGDITGYLGYLVDITERKERERELEVRVAQQKAVTELGRRALEGPDLDELMAEAAEAVAETLDNDYCKVLDLDPDSEELLLRQGVGWREGIVGSATVSAIEDDSQAAYTLASREPVVVSDLTTETRFSGPDLLTDHDVRSGVSTIIGPTEDPWGILGTHDRAEKQFSEHDVNFVESVANILATAIDRHQHEQELVLQRERLSALDDLNGVVREITDAVIEQSTREEIEQAVCAGLADSESYEFAWIGDVDPATQTMHLRAESGVDDYLDDITISVDPDDRRSEGPTGRAVLTGEMQAIGDVEEDVHYEHWRERAREYGFRSSAAIPVVHEGVRYGVINVYADRPNAFTGDEGEVIEHLGEIVGHAIAAVERKRALTSDEVVEIAFQIPGVFDAFGLPEADGRITLDRAVPVGDGTYLEYGSATEDMLDVLDDLVETLPHWESVRVLGESPGQGLTRFELRLDDPPVLSTVTALGGYVDRATIEDGDYRMRIHLAPNADARRLIDHVQDTYPMAQLVSRQQVTREVESPIPLLGRLAEHLTERQLSALEAAYFAGYFEWPRDVNGEDVADSLGVSAPTFHQHLRKAQKKLLGIALDDEATA